MEDALAPTWWENKEARKTSLNPCCNGRCTRTFVFILFSKSKRTVLILVVMEDALAQATDLWWFCLADAGLNPCCNGRCTRTNRLLQEDRYY